MFSRIRKLWCRLRSIFHRLCHFFSEKFKSFLEQNNFKISSQTANNKLFHFLDFVAATIYAVVSGYLIWNSDAGRLVILLNMLCMLRVTFSCNIKASDVTRGRNIDDNCGRNNYYHMKANGLGLAELILTVVFVSIGIDKLSSTTAVAKTLATIPLVIVLVHDVEEIIIHTYDATCA